MAGAGSETLCVPVLEGSAFTLAARAATFGS